jgi:hypothetical protein
MGYYYAFYTSRSIGYGTDIYCLAAQPNLGSILATKFKDRLMLGAWCDEEGEGYQWDTQNADVQRRRCDLQGPSLLMLKNARV